MVILNEATSSFLEESELVISTVVDMVDRELPGGGICLDESCDVCFVVQVIPACVRRDQPTIQ